MNALQNLSIRNKFFLIVFPILIGVIYLVVLKMTENYQVSQNLAKLDNGVELGVTISQVVHEIQKERGNSSGYLSNEGTKFGEQLSAQRKLTDEKLDALNQALVSDKYQEIIKENSDGIQQLNQLLSRIPSLRSTVDALRYTPNEAIDAYTELNTYALNFLDALIPTTGQSEIALQIQGFINFLKSKERAGIERAIGSQAFSKGKMDAEVYKRFSTLVAQQDAYMDAFLLTALDEYEKTYQNTLVGFDVEEVDRMRAILYQNENLSEDPIYWFAKITGKIELLKKFENFLADRVLTYSKTLSQEALTSFWTFLVVAVVLILIDLALLFSVLFGILGSIGKLSDYTKVVAQGDFTKKVELKAKDEIGSFADVLNTTVGAISDAQNDLKAEKTKAEDLYENIYKTSEVVFENVNQGIFLLTDELKISNLHSNAALGILDQEQIAGESFLSIMKPMLIPRDMDALKVYSKHLFNPHVKDRALKRLNPVEQIEIFSKSKDSGLVSKFISVSFSRIKKGKQVENVMVTILDETDAVLMQKQLRENEEQKRTETDQLLNIIKINPIALREFLDKAQVSLNEIYVRYEKDKSKDFAGLVSFTFNIIHSLKGNAGLIELELAEEKLHKIEESLTTLRGANIKGEDFVKVLYEINELRDIVNEMDGMLNRIASIYHEASSKEQILSNDRFVSAIDRAVNRIGNETGKQAELVFINDNDIILPEKYKLQINDVIIQLIRNSMIHGIERPAERTSAGKDRNATIRIEVNKGLNDDLVIQYSDDGRGLDRDKILARAKANGLMPEAKTQLSDKETYKLIFEEGFSTEDEVNKHAGRGQGMSVIKSTLDKINGQYIVSSTQGSQFEMTFSIPLTETKTFDKIAI